jgi:hypothetical protein
MTNRSPFPPRGAAVMPPAALPLERAIAASAPLVRLGERLRQSRGRHASIVGVLPAALREQVQPGPVDDRQWVLLAGSAAVAAKLRQCLPSVEQALREAGWPPLEIRVRVRRA